MAQVLNRVSCAIYLILHIIIYIPYYYIWNLPQPLQGRETFSLFAFHFSLFTPHFSLLTSHSSLLTPHSSLLTPNSSLLTPNSKKFPENLVVRKKLLTFALAYEK